MVIMFASPLDQNTVLPPDKAADLPATDPDTGAPTPAKDTILILLQDPANLAAVVQHFFLVDLAQIKALQTIEHGEDAQALLGIPDITELESFLLLDPGSRKTFVFTTTPHTVGDAVSFAPAPELDSGQLPDGPCSADPGVTVPILVPYIDQDALLVSGTLPDGPCTTDSSAPVSPETIANAIANDDREATVLLPPGLVNGSSTTQSGEAGALSDTSGETRVPETGAALTGDNAGATQGGGGPADNGAFIVPVAGNGGNEAAGTAAGNPPEPAVAAIPPADPANQITEQDFLNPVHHGGQEAPGRGGGGGGGGITFDNVIGVSLGIGVLGSVIALLVLSSEKENNNSDDNNNGIYPLVATEAPGDQEVSSHELVVGLDSSAGVLAVGGLGTDAAQGGMLDQNPPEVGVNENGGDAAAEIPVPVNLEPEAIELIPVNAEPEAAIPPAAPEADEPEPLPEAPGADWNLVIGGGIGSMIVGAGLVALCVEVNRIVSDMEGDHSHDTPIEQLTQDVLLSGNTGLAPESTLTQATVATPPVVLSLAATPISNAAVEAPLHFGTSDMISPCSVMLSFEFSPPSGAGESANFIHHSDDIPAIQSVLAHWMASIDPGFAATVLAFDMLDYNWTGDGGVMLQLLVSDMPVIPEQATLMALQYAMQDYLAAPDHPASLDVMAAQALTLVGSTGFDGLV